MEVHKEFTQWKDQCNQQAAILNAEQAYKRNVCGSFIATIAQRDRQIAELTSAKPLHPSASDKWEDKSDLVACQTQLE